MPTVAIIPARYDSTRLPGKALLPVAGRPLLGRLLARLREAQSLDRVVLATTDLPNDHALARVAEEESAGVFRGDPEDVLGRMARAARAYGADPVVAVMGDSPLIHGALVDATVELFRSGPYDYVAGYTETVRLEDHGPRREFPIGLSVQVFSAGALDHCDSMLTDSYSREHSTSGIYRNPSTFRLGYLEAEDEWAEANRPDLFLAVNLPDQYELVNAIFERCLPEDPDFDTATTIRAADAVLDGVA